MSQRSLKPFLEFPLSFHGSFGDRLLRSIEYLSFKARSHNAKDACETVDRILAEQSKYSLYRDLFSKEWSASKTSLYKAGRYKLYSERVCELFELINEHCFPLLEYWNDDPEAVFERFAIIPMNFDLCCEDLDFENLRISYVAGLLFYFQESDIWDFLTEKYDASPEEFPMVKRDSHPGVWKTSRSAAAKPYEMLLKLVDHSTGNPWLDTTHCEAYETFDWSKETIEGLTRDYLDVGKWFTNLEELDQKMEEDPKQFLSELISFWNNGKPNAA